MEQDIVIREAVPDDMGVLARLAALDSAPVPRGRVLLAESDGALRAALALEGGTAIADPFHYTAELVALLELRAAQLEAEERRADRGAGATARRSAALRPAPAPGRG